MFILWQVVANFKKWDRKLELANYLLSILTLEIRKWLLIGNLPKNQKSLLGMKDLTQVVPPLTFIPESASCSIGYVLHGSDWLINGKL